jgi:hypothetical protein
MADLQEKSIELWRDSHFKLHWKLRAAEDRIEKLEAALRGIAMACDYSGADYVCREIAREALGGHVEEMGES